jgi:DNA-binding NarL/FixJ family response regulator
MPGLNGLQAAKRLQEADSRSKIIFLTVYEGVDFLEAALSAGASGYVNKSRLSTDLIPAIHEAMSGQTLYPRRKAELSALVPVVRSQM